MPLLAGALGSVLLDAYCTELPLVDDLHHSDLGSVTVGDASAAALMPLVVYVPMELLPEGLLLAQMLSHLDSL